MASRPDLRSCDEPPLYTINLSLPPHPRYRQLCSDYKKKLESLASLYDESMNFLGISWIGRLFLRAVLKRVYSTEETEEVRGIAKAVGVPVYLVVAYNTLLDLFSGCVSAGAKVGDSGEEGKRNEGMVHLRGLDWDMEPLRELIVRVEYVREGRVVARGVTYAGYTGVLTGVREGLSISFNYRASLFTDSTPITKHRIHQLLMLLGFRRSVPSHLREILLAPSPPQTLNELAQWAKNPKTRLSSCYLTFCSPSSVLMVERELVKAKCSISTTFLVCTNHDVDMESLSKEERVKLFREHGVDSIMEDSVERKDSLVQLLRESEVVGRRMGAVKEWLEQVPLRNEFTHFSCIMDPSVEGGGLVWVQRYPALLVLSEGYVD